MKIWPPNLCLCDSVVLQINKSHCTERFVNLPCDCLHPLIWSWDGYMVDTQGGKINHRYSWHCLHYIWKKYLNLFAYYLCRCLVLQCVQIQRKIAWALPDINMSRYILQSRYFLPCSHEQLLNWKNSKKTVRAVQILKGSFFVDVWVIWTPFLPFAVLNFLTKRLYRYLAGQQLSLLVSVLPSFSRTWSLQETSKKHVISLLSITKNVF